jgi:hemerythrin-like domain-containing protein
MGATDFLKREHEIVLRVLGRADREVAAIAETGTMDAAAVTSILLFLRDFLGNCHHVKEDHRLFPRVEETGMPIFEVPLAVLRREHDEGRERIGSLLRRIESGECQAEAIGEGLREYATLLRRHMAREEELLFPLAERSLTPMDLDELEREFRLVDEAKFGEAEYEESAPSPGS